MGIFLNWGKFTGGNSPIFVVIFGVVTDIFPLCGVAQIAMFATRF